MRTSTDRILTTHTGSLPRPDVLAGTTLLDPHGTPATAEQLRQAAQEIVAAQHQHGVDVVNDGEVSKTGYSTYITERLDGFGGNAAMPVPKEYLDFPAWAQRQQRLTDGDDDALMRNPACVGPISYRDTAPVLADIDNVKAAAAAAGADEVFMSAASPGVISIFQPNQHYASEEDYIGALAEAMKTEYDLIARAGLVLQLDCPDLAMGWNVSALGDSPEGFQRKIAQRVEAINYATGDIDPGQLRMHLCWGNYEGPHHLDVPLADIISTVLTARPSAILFEAANPRHAHEYAVFDDVQLPEDKVLIPGVLDSTTNYIEHPQLVAQRLLRFAERVGRERVMAGTDCGFATFASYVRVDPAITWAKFDAMAEGARLASEQLWSRAA